MQNNKIAILIDGGFFVQRFKAMNSKRLPLAKDVQQLIINILASVQSKSGVITLEHLLRVYYYDCMPFGKTIESFDKKTKIDYSKTHVYNRQNRFLNDLKTQDQLALRLGQVSFAGWKLNVNNPKAPPVPDFRQKGVDMKIGLDIAWIAGKRIVDKIVLVTGDSDFIAPIKLARREGILIYLYPMQATYIKTELKEHADFILT